MRLDRSEAIGIGFALASATAFGATTVIAKFAYRRHVDVQSLLCVRFAAGAAMLWTLAFLLRVPRGMSRGQVLRLFGLGVGYSLQSRLFFEGLKHIPAGPAGLLLYAYPAFVAILAFALGRERLGVGKIGALAFGLAGVALVSGSPAGHLNVPGVSLALGAAAVYAVYIIVAEHAIRGVHPLVSSATIVTGAAASFAAVGLSTRSLHLAFSASTWMLLIFFGFVSVTVAAATFLIALDRIGPTRASIASTFEPIVTVILAAATLGERLRPLQLVGGAFIVAAVAALPALGSPHAATDVTVAPEADRRKR